MNEQQGAARAVHFPRAPLLMKPCFSPRPWGGTRLANVYSKETPEGVVVGEAWELSDHPGGASCIASGQFAGRTFGDLLREFPREMIGRSVAPDRFPLLVKFIDAAQDLSIQVHPADHHLRGRSDGERGKMECWYFMEAAQGAEVIHGLRDGITGAQLQAACESGEVQSLVVRHPIAPHSFLFVPPGTVHALLAGTLVCEIQQSSDTTYRLWDWNRQPARPLHVCEAIEVIDPAVKAPLPQQLKPPASYPSPIVLTDNEFFRVRLVDLSENAGFSFEKAPSSSGQIVICVHGRVSLAATEGTLPMAAGTTAFLPHACDGEATLATASSAARVLIAESKEL